MSAVDPPLSIPISGTEQVLLDSLWALPLQSSPSYLMTQLFNGLVLGMVLILIALGLSIIFGMMDVINFAHGDLLLVGTYTTWAMVEATGSIFLGLLVAPVVVAGVGILVERLTLQFTYGRDPLLQLLLTFGIAEILREGVQVVWGRSSKAFPAPEWGQGTVDLVLFSYPRYRVFLLFATMAIVVALYLVLYRTDIGLIIRAGTYDREMTGALGINIERVFMIVFALGAAIAGLAGGLIGPIRGVHPLLGVNLLIPSFVVVVIGGTGSLLGTVVSGLIIGQILTLTGMVFPDMARIAIFVFMAAVLLIRPEGLFGNTGVTS